MDVNQDDDLLVAEVQAALRVIDPIPDHVIDAAKDCFTWRRVDAELAALASDTMTQPLAGVRSMDGPTEPRLLTFRAPGLTVEVEVTPYGEQRRLVGQLVPPRSAEIEVRWQGGSVTSEADPIGLFSAGAVPAGPVSIACRPSDAADHVVTSWVTI